MLRHRGVWVASYLISAEPNACCIVCLTPRTMPTAWKNARRVINALTAFTVARLRPGDDLARKGDPALADTEIRHGSPRHARGATENPSLRLRQGHSVPRSWAPGRGDCLAGWYSFKCGRLGVVRHSPLSRRRTRWVLAPNNAMRHVALDCLLVEEVTGGGTTGLSSINPSSDPRTLYEYNTRIGFEGRARCGGCCVSSALVRC